MAWFQSAPSWDLTALLNAADPRARLADRNLWLARLLEWLRHPAPRDELAGGITPLPVLRIKHLLNVLERNPEHAQAFAGVLNSIWRDVDAIGLFADVGFAPRVDLWAEFMHRLRQRLLPRTADTTDLAELFDLLFPAEDDEHWLMALDEDLLARLSRLLRQPSTATATTTASDIANKDWQAPMLSGLTTLVSAVRADGLAGVLRRRMSAELLVGQPFEQLASACDDLVDALGDSSRDADDAATAQALQYLRALLDACRRAAASIPDHLEAHGVSIEIVFALEQMQARILRIEALLDCLVASHPQREMARLLASLVRVVHERRSISQLFSSHYSLLARKVAERSAETGEHYITRDRADYRAMLKHAAGGGAIIAGTTFAKFSVVALGLSAFWSGFWAGANYAMSFLIIHLLHWTVATKQPAMTAPAMAHKLEHIDDEGGLNSFVDEVANLLRSQFAGIFGNLAVVAPIVLGVQLCSWLLFGAPLVGEKPAHYVLHSLTLLGPSALFAAFTGVLLFASSMVAGWVENWFVLHRLESAIAWNPGVIARLGKARAQRWAHWWRDNISGVAANVSLGMMLGLVPVLLNFIGLPLDVRHVTLSTGQLFAAIGALGFDIFRMHEFWWCVAGIALTGVLNLSVSFYLALKVAMRSRGVRLADQTRLSSAIWRRLREQPRSFFLPPKRELAPQAELPPDQR
ncbi:site-specific recombinase [Paucibacter sp. Y2R2-4]|uniref:site-specific recombinase n=1 Tax=Paucibacter sp. Y2R2-4 TaxID=2893553 RepID=UPI0021E46405|nr:site-specific recombinase [Paucibacter sp. Y2R2-4]MCV2350979.1 site-specific recombinase [Paucibacter sp. Y2R2-4]